MKNPGYEMATALWLHGPAMLAEMTRCGVNWPEFRGSEMADLIAYLHGARLRMRNGNGAGQPDPGRPNGE